MDCLLVVFSMLDYLGEDCNMFDAAVDSFNEGFLCRIVNITVGDKELGESLWFQDVVGFPEAAGKRDHSEICRITSIATFMDEDDGTAGPYVRSNGGQVQFVIQSC